MTEQRSEDIIWLLVASDELLLEELFKHVQVHLFGKQTSWVQKNYVLVLHNVIKLESCKNLQDYCLKSICKDPQPFVTSETFPLLDKDILFGLFKCDDFQVEEIVAWDSLIKWGIKQTPELENKNNQNEWTDKNYEDLKNTLSDFIPLIKFLKITSEDFHHKVRPYKAVIPSNIYEETMTYYLVEQPKQYINLLTLRIESNIINQNIANIIANWIDRNDSAVFSPNNKYKFNLIYSMSRDGLNNVTFYSKCNGQGPFVVLVRVQSKKIYGGYNPIGYASRQSQWLASTESFIFSFENDQDIHNMKIDRVINANYSVSDGVNHSDFFNFGDHLYIHGQKLYAGNSGFYSNTLGNVGYLPIEEMEVFSVIKK